MLNSGIAGSQYRLSYVVVSTGTTTRATASVNGSAASLRAPPRVRATPTTAPTRRMPKTVPGR
jgi:hypothetical protein